MTSNDLNEAQELFYFTSQAADALAEAVACLQFYSLTVGSVAVSVAGSRLRQQTGQMEQQT